jgi:hypothetical protein
VLSDFVSHTECEPQERELGVLVRDTPPPVPAVHDPRFLGMQSQPDLSHPFHDRRQHLAVGSNIGSRT